MGEGLRGRLKRDGEEALEIYFDGAFALADKFFVGFFAGGVEGGEEERVFAAGVVGGDVSGGGLFVGVGFGF